MPKYERAGEREIKVTSETIEVLDVDIIRESLAAWQEK
jgi:hypothetical protein